jgi:hypothetical protein
MNVTFFRFKLDTTTIKEILLKNNTQNINYLEI